MTLINPIKKIKRLDEPDPDDFYYPGICNRKRHSTTNNGASSSEKSAYILQSMLAFFSAKSAPFFVVSVLRFYCKIRDYKPDEVVRILETSKQFSARNNWHAVFTTFFYTGMRRNELRFLTWEDINFQDKIINIRPKEVNKDEKFRVKNRRSRIIPLLSQVEEVLKALSKKSDRWVFTNSRGNTFSNDTIRQEFRKICKAAGLPIKKLHLTRHSWTSIAYEKGVPEPTIQAAGGWNDPKTMRHYNHSGANREYVNRAFQEKFNID